MQSNVTFNNAAYMKTLVFTLWRHLQVCVKIVEKCYLSLQGQILDPPLYSLSIPILSYSRCGTL